MGRGAFSPIALSRYPHAWQFAHLFLTWRSPFVSLSFARLSRMPYPLTSWTDLDPPRQIGASRASLTPHLRTPKSRARRRPPGAVLDTARAGRAPSRSSGSGLTSSASPLGKRPKGPLCRRLSRRERTLASNSVREGTGCRSLEPNERGGAVRRRQNGRREARRRSPARTPRPASRAARASGSRVERRSPIRGTAAARDERTPSGGRRRKR